MNWKFFIIFTSKIADSGYVNLVDLVSKLAPRPFRNISFDLSYVGGGGIVCDVGFDEFFLLIYHDNDIPILNV